MVDMEQFFDVMAGQGGDCVASTNGSCDEPLEVWGMSGYFFVIFELVRKLLIFKL